MEHIVWNEYLIESEIKRTMDILCIEHMPSRTDMKLALGNDALSNKVAKTGGFVAWGNRLLLKTKVSDTSLGQNYEIKAMELLKLKGFEVERMTTKHPFDLLVNDNIRIDVKVGRPGDINNSIHTFRMAKKYATCDLYMIFALDGNGAIGKLFIIPGNELKVVTMCIGRNSKYDVYLNRWDLINKYDTFYKQLG